MISVENFGSDRINDKSKSKMIWNTEINGKFKNSFSNDY